MAFSFGRGRGRGRGGFGGGGFRPAKQLPFELFPEIEELGTSADVKVNFSFAVRYNRLQKYWNSSPYYIGNESAGSKKTQRKEIERFSARKLEKTKEKALLSDFIRMEPDYVPAELAKGEKKEKHGIKRVRWNPESGRQRWDFYEQKEVNEKKEDEEEEEDEKIEEEEEEISDDGDYTQNIDFDDDEDDFNMADDNDDEPIF